MQFTNNHNLPPAVFDALVEDDYDKGESDMSCTEILKPPRMVQLQHRHKDEIIEDAIDRLWSVLGRAVHNIFEKNVEDDAVAEIRMYIESCGKIIGGQLDHYKEGVISDYKITSVWTWIFGSRIQEWTEQQNIYSAIYRKNGFTVNKLQIVIVFRDWKENDFKKNPSKYPPLPIMTINLEVWPDGNVQPFIDYRVAEQIKAESLPDNELPLCTDLEMWAMPDKYAVYKNELKKASRVLDSEDAAMLWIDEHKAKDAEAAAKKKKATKLPIYYVHFRPGKRNRCEKYCTAAPFCNTHQAYMKAKETQDDPSNNQ